MHHRETTARLRPVRPGDDRCGFSLMEIMVVLAVFVVITALSVPLLQRTFSGQHLRSAADTVRAQFGRARVHAIERGDVYGFFYAPNSSEFFVAPMVVGFRTMISGQVTAIGQQQLENRIVFAAGETIQDARSLAEMENAEIDLANIKAILFYPDGTSQDATLILQDIRGGLIQVNLRGLTGVSSASRILSVEEVLQ